MIWRLACTALALFAFPARASAACTVSAVDVVFGVYDGFSGAPLDYNGTVTVTCDASSGTSPIAIALNVGSVIAGGSSYAERNMANSTNYLGFNLYTDSARATVWGDGTANSQTVTAPASLATNGGSKTFTVYGRVRAGQRRYTPPGNYLTVITATLTY